VRDVLVAGTGMTRFGKYPHLSLKDLSAQAAVEALKDANVSPSEVEMIFFANAAAGLITGQEMIRGQVALREMSFDGIPIINVENACASGSSAFYLASTAIAAGQCDLALALGAEKLVHPDKGRTFEAIASAIDLERRADLAAFVPAAGENQLTSRSLFMDIYARLSVDYMARTGATDADFARVAVKNHRHGSLNGKAQYGQELTVDQVLASRTISGPLTLLMCSPIGDGAAAVLLCSADRARRLGIPPVRVRGVALVSGSDDGESAPTRAVRRAYDQAGVGPDDLDVVELHDATAPAELILYEELGLCRPTEGAALLASGATELGGRLPVNVSGGLLSKGHPVGATGCAQVVELADQLRERAGKRQVPGARIGLAENAGGFLGPDQAVAAISILVAG